MISPTSPTPNNLSDEDSSGSEAGLEPETDRFGFIVTNGSTAGSVGPPPELVRQREAKWINIISQWDRILLKKTSKVKVQCQKGIPASLRAKCWPLLCGATDKMKQHENLYKTLDSQPALQSWVDVIERDLDRQFPFHEMFLSKDGHGQRGLFRVLKAYTQYQPEEGYCQGQGPVAAVLLMNMPAEEAFWCLAQISEQYLPGYYSPLLEGVLFDAAMLTWVLKRTCPAAHKHLQHHGVEPLMFATDWLMCLFTRHLPFNTLLRVWDLFFCNGVRVLLQVAVVLVRRVLGRTQQRKQCPGQMETLERLRGVREQVHDEDDTFIAEVCSVQLSARDLEKQTEKELVKWRKDRPSSTFDPRGRCQGYQMAWARARQNQEERDRKEREKGNLSVPLARSASTLSLSPSLLKKLGRGGKANPQEGDGGRRIVRHVSMGAREDSRSWTFNFKKVQRVQEEDDVFSEEHKKQSELKLTTQTEPKETKNMEIQKVPTEHTEEQVEQVETRITEKEESKLKDTEEQMEEANVNTEQTKDQTVVNNLQPTEHRQAEELDSNSQSQQSPLEIEVKETNKETNNLQPAEHRQAEELDSNSQSPQSPLEMEVKETNKERENQVAQSEHTAAVKVSQTDVQSDAGTDKDTEVELQEGGDPSEELMIHAGLKPEESTGSENVQQAATAETGPGTEHEAEAPTVKVTITETETETQHQQQEVITDGSSQEGKCHSTESLAETVTESHTQTQAETDDLSETQGKVEDNAASQEFECEETPTDSEQHSHLKAITLVSSSPECNAPNEEGINSECDCEAARGSSEGLECDAAGPEATQEEDISLTAQVDQTQAEVRPEGQMNETTSQEMTSTQDETLAATAESDGKRSSEVVSTHEEQVTESPLNLEVEESTESVQKVMVTESTDSPSPQLREKKSHTVTDQTKSEKGGLTQASERRSSRSSGDFHIRKSSNSHGSRLARRLSEDLFTTPEKTSQSQSTPYHREVKGSDSAANPTQSPPAVTSEVSRPLSAEVSERTARQPETPKRFGVFRRLRGEQPKKMQVPKIMIQDFSEGMEMEKPVEWEEKLSSRERRKKRRERERREKEEERLRKKREKELGKEKEERRKPQTRGKSFQVQGEKGSRNVTDSAKTGSQTRRYSASHDESYF